MIKKILLVSVLFTLGIGMVGCNKNRKSDDKTETKQETTTEEEEKFVAFITDAASIDDKSFNEGSWKGVLKFAEKSGYKKEYFRPADDTEEADAE